MPLQKFPLLQDNTRLIRFKDTLYKVKVKYKVGTFVDQDVRLSQAKAHDEIEQTFRAVLYLSERNQNLKPIATPNFLIQPYKIFWSFPKKCSDYSFQQNGKSLKVFDYMFEFHISNRKSEKDVSKEAVNVDDDRKRNVADNKVNKLKEAVVVVSDIGLEAAARFGRTKDGQLYRVYTHKTGSGDGGGAEIERNQHEKVHEDSKKVSVKERKEQISGKGDIETTKQKLITPRDKFSLRLSELREMKRENVQSQRLRNRKANHVDQKIQKGHKPKINYREQLTESENTEDKMNNQGAVQRVKISSQKLKLGKLKAHMKSGQLNKSSQKNKAHLKNTRNQLKERAYGKRLRERREQRRERHRATRTDRSQKVPETTDGSQDSSRSRKVKLYSSKNSPQVVAQGSKPVTDISSPKVSTVLPVKRSHTDSDTRHAQHPQPTVTSTRITRQSLHDDESRRIQSLREERPTQIYRDIMLAQGRDRYKVEQAESADTDKLRQLYEPTVSQQSTRIAARPGTKRRRSSDIWGKIMDSLVTPTKKFMFGDKK